MRSHPSTVTGWGRAVRADVTEHIAGSVEDLASAHLPSTTLIPRGLGRSYGDAAQRSGGNVVTTTDCRHVQWVDRAAGVVRVDAGVTIGDLVDRFSPKGWFVPVSPGTRQVTIGGAIAADIHGKNHHCDGTFGEHLLGMRLRLADGAIAEISPESDPDLFWTTVGGMGLTGIILDAHIRLHEIPTTTVRVETERFETLDAMLERMRVSDIEHRFSVGWVDLLASGRGVLTQGSFAPASSVEPRVAGRFRRPRSPAFGLPPVPNPRLVHTLPMRAFNTAWWRRAPSELTISHETITPFFYPLDAITNWNRLYGPNGFYQWQFVVPDSPDQPLEHLCDRLATTPSYLTVLKRFGARGNAPLSFPMPGWTLAVDLPATDAVRKLLVELDRIVLDAGGRVYLAKDARLERDVFEQMYPRLDEWKAVRHRIDPNRVFSSDLSVRLGL